jgi:hypothetical protein
MKRIIFIIAATIILILVAVFLFVSLRPKPVVMVSMMDPSNDVFGNTGQKTTAEPYIDLVGSQIGFTGKDYIFRIIVAENIPKGPNNPAINLEYGVLIDADSNAKTGGNVSLYGDGLGIDYIASLSLMDSGIHCAVLSNSGKSVAQPDYNIADNKIEIKFNQSAIGSPDKFRYRVVIRKWLVNPGNTQTIGAVDVAPNDNYYTFSK